MFQSYTITKLFTSRLKNSFYIDYKSHDVAMSPPLLIVIAIRQINLKMWVNDYKKNWNFEHIFTKPL